MLCAYIYVQRYLAVGNIAAEGKKKYIPYLSALSHVLFLCTRLLIFPFGVHVDFVF